MSTDSLDPGHGHSPAAWTAVIIMLIGFVVGTVGFYLAVPVVVWIGVAIIIIGLIAGFVLAKMGYGVNGSKYQPKGH